MSEVEIRDQWEVCVELRDPGLTYNRFDEICAFLGTVNTEVRFAIGDAIVMGPELFGESAYQAMEKLQLSEDGMQEYARVSRKIPPSIRRKGLSWSHHRAVAALEPGEQKDWLKRAKDEGLSHHALREELRNGAEPQASTSCRCCGRPL